jgi:hypothetical protein
MDGYPFRKLLNAGAFILLVMLIGTIVFLLQRPCDYRASFTVGTSPDVAYFHILNWHTWNRKQAASIIEVTGREPVSHVSHEVSPKDTNLIFRWEISATDDSTTLVRACVSDPDRKWINRLTVPFLTTAFENSVRGNLLDMIRRLDLMLQTFHYEFKGYSTFEERSCVCMALSSTQRGKAGAMISSVTALNQFVRQHDLVLEGDPFVVVHNWNEYQDSIHFEFCFPIGRSDAVPAHPEIRLKRVEAMKAIKTEFHGNYSISDITWYNLVEEAGRLGHQRNGKLVEVYYHDPHAGGNELEWKADIYLGINDTMEVVEVLAP